MRRIATARIASLVAALTAGAFAAYTLRSGSSDSHLARVQQPAVEVRTQVIRRTVHVVRHERAHAHRSARVAHATGASSGVAAASGTAAPRTGASGSHAASPVATGTAGSGSAPRTRASGATGGSTGAARAHRPAAPVRTHSSGAASHKPSSSGSQPVRTRTSGGGGEHEGARDD